MKVHLIAVQARMTLQPYRSAQAFADWILALSEQAVAGLDDAPKLIAFPEVIGLPLLLTLGQRAELASQTRLTGAVQALLQREWRSILRAALRYRAFGPQSLFLARALPAYRAYVQAFSRAAERTGATIVAGSSELRIGEALEELMTNVRTVVVTRATPTPHLTSSPARYRR